MRCQSPGTPSSAAYMHMGETTARLGTVRPRSRSGWNIGGAGVLDVDVEARRLDAPREVPVDLGDEAGRAQREVLVGDRLGAGHDAEGELDGFEIPEARDVLEPDQRDVGGVLRLLDLLAPSRLEAFERRLQIVLAGHRLVERDGVLHGELGARADREMRRRLGVAEKDGVVLHPARVADHREVAPERAVGDEPVAGEIVGEEPLEEARRLVLRHRIEPGPAPGLVGALHDPGRAALLVLVGVGDEDAGIGLAEREGEGVERTVGAEPDELVGPQVDHRLEVVGETVARLGVDAVPQHDEVMARHERLDALDLGLEAQR